jgi:outer membrane protein assembly factor BamB
MIEKQTYVFAFDLSGKQVWKKSNGKSWGPTMSHASAYIGSRSTPTYNDGIVYHLSDLGRLAALNSQTGDEIWVLELRQDFDAGIPEYGYSESVFIEGERLYCNPAGNKGFMICLNKKSGDLIWANTEITGTVGFSSPVIGEFAGFRQLINLSSNCVYGVDTKTGTLLWSVEYRNQRSNNCPDPIFHDGYVFVSSGYGKGSALIKLTSSENSIIPEMVWHTELMDNIHGGVILHDGYLYGSGDYKRGWYCLDFKTGKQMWKERGIGTLIYADGMFYCMEERGMMKLIKATPKKYEVVSSFQVPNGGEGMHWAHPVVCGGRLYVRHADKLFAYNINGK